MRAHRLFTSFIALCIGCIAFAQSGYEFEIRQVYPKNARVVIKAFSFKREMENEISSQSQRLRGNSNNYKILITTPAGKETRYIQNITWIQTINGVTTPHKSKTKPAESYPESTIWTGTACNIDGSPKGTPETHEFIYRVAVGATKNYKTEFLELATAQAKAESLFAENLVEDKLIEYVVYCFKGDEIVSVYQKNNELQYNEYLAACQAEVERLEAERRLASSIDGFKLTMTGLQAAKDSLKTNGIHNCLEAIRSTVEVVPDSIFVREKLDSVYRSVLFGSYLPTKKKAIKPIQRQYDRLKDEGLTSRDSLMFYTEEIEKILLPAEKK